MDPLQRGGDEVGSKVNYNFAVPSSSETEGALSSTADQVDLAGQAILNLLQKASRVAEGNSRRCLEAAERLLAELRAAENRIAKLEADNQGYRERSERAEQWLRRIYSEIQESFIRER